MAEAADHLPIPDAMQRVRVCRLADLAEGQVAGVDVGDRKIALYCLDGRVFATDDQCTHAKVSLSEGRIVGRLIQCPLHVAWFDIETGKGMGPPISRDLRTYPVTVIGDEVEVTLPADTAASRL